MKALIMHTSNHSMITTQIAHNSRKVPYAYVPAVDDIV